MLPNPDGQDNSNGRLETPHPSLAGSRLGARIESESEDRIQVGAGGKLIVPNEDFSAGLDDSSEIDLVSQQPTEIRKPGRHEWFMLNRSLELATRMLPLKHRPNAMEKYYYYIDEALRGPIRDDLKDVRVLPFYSLSAKSVAIWIITVTPDNSWYESIAQLLRQPPEFFSRNKIRIFSDTPKARYRVRYKPETCDVVWPSMTTGELLGETLGADRFIRSSNHPVYRDLLDGTELI